MFARAGRLATAMCALALALAPAVGAAQTLNLGDLCAENGAGPVTEDTLVLHTTEAIPSFCLIILVDASLRVVGSDIAVSSLSIARSGAGTVTITDSNIATEAAISIVGGAGPVRIVDSFLSGSNNSEIEISGDIRIHRSELSWDTLSSATFLTFATSDGAVDVRASRLSNRANSFGLTTLRATEGLAVHSSEVIADLVELDPQGKVAFVNNEVATGSEAPGGPATVAVLADSDPDAVVVVGNTFEAGAVFRFQVGVQADRCVIEANDPKAAVVGAEDACP